MNSASTTESEITDDPQGRYEKLEGAHKRTEEKPGEIPFQHTALPNDSSWIRLIQISPALSEHELEVDYSISPIELASRVLIICRDSLRFCSFSFPSNILEARRFFDDYSCILSGCGNKTPLLGITFTQFGGELDRGWGDKDDNEKVEYV